MSNELDDFVKNNRAEFDRFEPGPVVWHNIQQELKRPAEKKGILISMKILRWSAAAAIILALGAGSWYLMNNNKKKPDIARATDLPANNDSPVNDLKPIVTDTAATEKYNPPGKINEDPQIARVEDADFKEELVHYTRLVELKQNQIKRITKDEPLLYQQFAGDFNKLDSTFHILKKQLPVNPNHEQILEAMIQNLQYQEALLNQQLNIIKKISNTKKEAYEKAYRSA
ncbi:MAG: hypothetical protein ABIQ88_14010 [Chitinophagaceae bacterium]